MKSLKSTLRARQPTIGSWLNYSYEATTEFMAKAGFDWLVVDMEHSANTSASLYRSLQVIELAGTVPVVRVGANDPLLIKHALESGAHGIIVPMINSAAEARRAAEAVHYPPRGTRGVGLWRAQGYGTSFEHYREWASRELVFLAQIEHWRAVEELEEILALDLVDGFIIGPYDLSGSLGEPGNFQNPAYVRCLEKVERIAKSHAKPAGFHLVHPDPEGRALREKLDAGYTFIAYGTDMIFFTSRVASEARRLKEAGYLSS